MGSKVLIISNSNELVRIVSARVVYVASDGNYSTFVLHDKTEQVFTMNLAHCQQVMERPGIGGFDIPAYRKVADCKP